MLADEYDAADLPVTSVQPLAPDFGNMRKLRALLNKYDYEDDLNRAPTRLMELIENYLTA